MYIDGRYCVEFNSRFLIEINAQQDTVLLKRIKIYISMSQSNRENQSC
jgi:hypothetical protein